MGDDFYRSKDPTNSIKVLKEEAVKEKTQKTKKTQITHAYTHKIFAPPNPSQKELVLDLATQTDWLHTETVYLIQPGPT